MNRCGWVTRGLACFILTAPLVVDFACGQANDPETNAANLGNMTPRFPMPLSPTLPLDVDTEALSKLDLATQLPEAQRLFDIFAWQQFLALNWQAKPDGQPDSSRTIGDTTGPRVWEFYRETSTVFLPDGSSPPAWEEADRMTGGRALQQTSKILNVNHPTGQLLDESLQAFTGPLVDQNGKWVFYEVLVNRTEFEYLVNNELYNQEGQAAYTAHHKIDFPPNTETQPGSMELKLAWKILGEGDIPGRFFRLKATVLVPQFDSQGNPLPKPKPEEHLVGLVGMHISTRTATSPQWIWATFEHVDNIMADALQFGTDRTGKRVRVRPSFNNPATPTKVVNTLPPKNAGPTVLVENGETKTTFTTWDPAKTTDPTQALRMVPIPPATRQLNDQVQELLREVGAVFQYYELVGTQWPTNPAFPAFPGGVIHYDGAPADGATSIPESLVYKAPGRMVPVLLTNMTMETFFQQGNQIAGGPERDDRLPASLGNAAQDPNARAFYTESCVGCHYSAGAVIGFKRDASGNLMRDRQGYKIPIYGENSNFGQTGNGHFSWLLQMKARQKERPMTSD